MKESTKIELLRGLIGNRMTRSVLSSLCKYCEKDGKNRLEVALELYVGARENACRRCRLAERPLASIISAGGKTFGMEEKEIIRAFQDPYWRKGLYSVVRGIASFGVRTPFVPGAPFQVVWDVTYACNLRCKHCYASAGALLQDELTTEESIELIDELATMGVPVIALSGGEPLVRQDIMQLIRYASEQGIYVALATNGTLISKEKARQLKEAGAQYVQISIDGADAPTHDEFRGIPGAFDRTLEGVRNAVDAGFFVNISTTITKKNVEQVPGIIDLCNDLEVNWFMAYNFIPTGRGRDMVVNDLDPGERETLLSYLFERNKSSKCQILSTAPQFARVALQQCGEGPIMVPTHFYNTNVDNGLYDLT